MSGRRSLTRSATTEEFRSAGCVCEERAFTGTVAGCMPSAQSDNAVSIGGRSALVKSGDEC